MININTKCLSIEVICAIILVVMKNIAFELSPISAHYFWQLFSHIDAQDLQGVLLRLEQLSVSVKKLSGLYFSHFYEF